MISQWRRSCGKMQWSFVRGSRDKLAKLTDYRAKPNGNTPAVPDQPASITSATMYYCSDNTLGPIAIPVLERVPSGKRCRMLGAYTICMATYGNGVKMCGTTITKVRRAMVMRGWRTGIQKNACFVVERGGMLGLPVAWHSAVFLLQTIFLKVLGCVWCLL